jgi:hypothetical protein
MAAKVTATKTAAKRTPRRPAPPPAPEPELEESPLDPGGSGEFEVLRLTTKADRPEERVPLFYIDDTMYSVAKKPGVNVGLQFMHLYRTQGEAVATDYVLDKLLGSEGYTALLGYDDLTPQQLQQICQIAVKLALGSLELPKE